MNERVRKLIKECGIPTEEYRIDGSGHGYLEPNFAVERLVKLIAQECVIALKKDMELAHIQLIPLDLKMYANGRLQRTINEHFGVEE